MSWRNKLRSVRLLIHGPHHDESISSILDRAAGLYCVAREVIAAELVIDAGYSIDCLAQCDFDDPPIELLLALSSALGISANSLEALNIMDGPSVLKPWARNSFCGVCFAEDLNRGHSPYFRRAWARTFKTFCQTHHQPLTSWWSGIAHGSWPLTPRVLLAEWQELPLRTVISPDRLGLKHWDWPGPLLGGPDPQACATMRLAARLDMWECDRQSALDAAEQGEDTASEKALREFVVSFAMNRQRHRANPISGLLHPKPFEWDLRRIGPMPPLGEDDPWDAFRSLSEPAHRRGAICFAACSVEPDMPVGAFIGWPRKNIPSGGREWWREVVQLRTHESLRHEMDLLRSAAIDGNRHNAPVSR